MEHMIYTVKRDGRRVAYDEEKIVNAIEKAVLATDGEITDNTRCLAQTIAKDITKELLDNPNRIEIGVEDIQDMVEVGLMKSARTDIAKNYITYRNERSKVRAQNSTLMQQIGEKLMATNVANQNANVDERSFGGRMGEARDVVTKEYALNVLMSTMAREHHLNNECYNHDLASHASGMHNCLTMPIDPLLANGFITRQCDVRPAGSVRTAMQLCAVLFQLQSLCQFGGVAAGHFDHSMVPFVRKSFAKHFKRGMRYIEGDTEFELTDKTRSIVDPFYMEHEKAYQYAMDMTKEETVQAAEAFFHNLNTLQSRSGDQLPFSSINLGTCTLPEGRLVIKAILDTCIAGTGKLHTTSIFPCLIFQMMKGVNRKEGDPNYDLYQLALKCTAQRLYPNYANCDWSGNEGYDPNDPSTYFATMGCRTANGWDINGLGQQKDGRGNICPVTIILPTIAKYTVDELEADGVDLLQAPDDVILNAFLKKLELYIEDAKEMLLERFRYIASQPPSAAPFMYQNHTMAGFDGKTTVSALKHGTLALGQLGLSETLYLLFGYDHTTKEGMEHAKKIESLFAEKCKQYKQEYHLNFGVYYTPAENLCYTAMKKFKERYGVIPNVSEKEFFTNSIHVPVWVEIDPFAKIDIESQLTGYSSAGCITYVELDSTAKHNLKALEELVNYAMDKDVPYFAINVPNDTCMQCGYTDEIPGKCPMCGSTDIQRLRRVTGYLSSDYHNFNKGKVQEVELRFQHTKLAKRFHVSDE